MRKILILTFLILIFLLNFTAKGQKCHCLSASKIDVPSQGNQMMISSEGKVKQVKGTVEWAYNLEPMENAVIEVFKTSEEEITKLTSYNGYSDDPDIARDQKIYQIARDKKRKTACRTAKNGRFCFRNLSKGLYILRIGLNRSADKSGMNEVYYVVEIDRKNGQNHEIEAAIYAAN